MNALQLRMMTNKANARQNHTAVVRCVKREVFVLGYLVSALACLVSCLVSRNLSTPLSLASAL